MGRRRKSGRTQGEYGIFGDEEAASFRTELTEMRELLANLTERVHAQFTTISAHAEIARQQAEFAREEARADTERTRELLIELIERTRSDFSTQAGVHVAGSAPGPSGVAQSERFVQIERQIGELAVGLERSFQRQQILADTLEALVDTVLAERRGEPVSGLSLV